MRIFFNLHESRHDIIRSYNKDVIQFHQNKLHSYKPTKLTKIRNDIKSGEIFIKEENARFGLPAFKVLGSSFASFIELCRIYDLDVAHTSIEELRNSIKLSEYPKPTLVTATDGNHGRGLAWSARTFGVNAHIFVPCTVGEASIRHIQSEGAIVETLNLDYDAAVQYASDYCSKNASRILVQDTSWLGYTDIPRNIVEGYTTILYELPQDEITHIICPVGVGSLAQACVEYAPPNVTIITVEPVKAPCLTQSLECGKIVPIQTENTIMAGLNCGLVSLEAWPSLLKGVKASILVNDEETSKSMSELYNQAIDAGPCGAATLAAWKNLLKDEEMCAKLGVCRSSKIVLLVTEGISAVK